jgi:DNA repair exonuclease SbcCD ATPase subunit
MSDEKEIKAPTYSVKTTNDITESVDDLLKATGLNNKDLFAAMVTQFKTNLMAGSDTEQTEDMQQIRYHLSHAESIFTNMVQKLHDLKENFTESIEQEKRVHQGIVDQVEKSRLQAEAERDKARLDLAEIQDRMKEISERNNELEAIQKSNHITVELLTNQNELLEARIDTVAEMEAEVQQLRAQQADNYRQIEKLQNDASQNIRILEMTKERLDTVQKEREQVVTDLHKSYDKELMQLKQAHTSELASAQKVADLQIHAAAVEASNRVLEATNKLKDEYTVKIEALQDKIQILTARVHELELVKSGHQEL